jgi:hypothetical protein
LTGVVRSDDRGLQWTSASAGLPASTSILGLAVSPHDANTVLAGLGDGTVFRTTDAGASWASASSGLDASDVTAFHFDPVSGTTIYAATTGGNQPGLYRTLDGGDTWTLLPGLGSVDVPVVAGKPDDANVLLVSTNAGIQRTTDAGATWLTVDASLQLEHVTWNAAATSHVFGVDGADAFHRSTDAGATFLQILDFDTDIVPGGSSWNVSALASNPTDEDQLYAATFGYAFDGLPVASRAYVLKSSTGGTGWGAVLADHDLAVGGPRGLFVDPGSPQTVLMGSDAMAASGFTVSTNGGSSWNARVNGLANFAVDIVRGGPGPAHYAQAGRHFAESAGGSAWSAQVAPGPLFYEPLRIDVSQTVPGLLHNSGLSTVPDVFFYLAAQRTASLPFWVELWSLFGSEPEVFSNHGDGQTLYAKLGPELYRSDTGGDPFDFVASIPYDTQELIQTPADPMTVYRSGSTVEISTDGGITWMPRNAGLPTSGAGVAGFFMDPGEPSRLVAVYSDGRVYRTANGGLNWGLLDTMSPGAPIRDVAWDPSTDHVFVATEGAGVISTHPNLDPTGLPTDSPMSLYYSPDAELLLVGTPFHGMYGQTITPPPTDAPVAAGELELSVRPNPFRTSLRITLSSVLSGDAELAVYDVQGRLVRELEIGAGATRRSWDGRDDQGQRVPAGLYFVKLVTAQGIRTAKATLLR